MVLWEELEVELLHSSWDLLQLKRSCEVESEVEAVRDLLEELKGLPGQ